MPRGIPNSGRRQPRVETAEPRIDPTDTAMAVDDAEAGYDAPIDHPHPQVDSSAPDAELIEVPAPPAADTAKPDAELTPEQQEIKRLRDRLAQSEGRKLIEPEIDPIAEGAEGNIVIHFLEDGLTALGRVFYRGDELEFEPGSQAYKDTFDRTGRSWLDFRFDEFAQVDRWGKVMFRNGAWPGKSYRDGSFESMRSERNANVNVSPPTEEELAAAEKARARRAAPKLPAVV